MKDPASTSGAATGSRGRIEAIDFARGLAVALMILSHGVNGIMDFSQMPAWGLVPIHLVTKFSSTLFILVFGIALAVAFLPYAGTAQWPARRNKLLVRGLVVFFWYKVLTVVEMMHLHEPEDIVEALRYGAFPSYVEILGFYAIALLWVPWVLPWWKRSALWLQLAVPVVMAGLAYGLYQSFHFWESEILQAILVEHEGHYAWGQLARGPLIFVGLLIGQWVALAYREPRGRQVLAACFGGGAMVLLFLFAWQVVPDMSGALDAIARNEGKHPPELLFMLFSLGGACALLGLTFLGGERLARGLRPITVIGSNALQAFIFHIAVIFIVFRYLLGYWHDVSYGFALTLAILLIPATALWIKTYHLVQGVQSK